jgi:GNAT superfamily N-acetyltransferase
MPNTKPRVTATLCLAAESDLAETDRVIRRAFGTFLGLPDPMQFMGDADYVRTRWKADPSALVLAEHDGKLVGANFAINWGSFGFFGPLAVAPEYWECGIAQQLMAPTMEIFRRWGSTHLGLYTFAQSPKHMRLYQKFGFWPRDLIAVMAKQVAPVDSAKSANPALFSDAGPAERPALLDACRKVTSAIFDGLDVSGEITAVATQQLGDTVLVWDGASGASGANGSKLAALAVCHTGPGSEAGTGVCYVKFAAVRPGSQAAADFSRLLTAIEAFASSKSLTKIIAGVNLARRGAFTELYSRGFRTELQGVAMETGSASSGYNRNGVYVLDDWR